MDSAGWFKQIVPEAAAVFIEQEEKHWTPGTERPLVCCPEPRSPAAHMVELSPSRFEALARRPQRR